MMGREIPKKLSSEEPMSAMTSKEDDGVDGDLAGEGTIDLDGSESYQAEEDKRGAQRIDQGEERAEAEGEEFPDEIHVSSGRGLPVMGVLELIVRRRGDGAGCDLLQGVFGAGSPTSSGSLSSKVVPWPRPSLRARTLPPCWAAMVRTRKRPRPVPLILTWSLEGAR